MEFKHHTLSNGLRIIAECNDEAQCGECGSEFEQPTRYPFKFCPACGAPFAAQDELLITLPFFVS